MNRGLTGCDRKGVPFYSDSESIGSLGAPFLWTTSDTSAPAQYAESDISGAIKMGGLDLSGAVSVPATAVIDETGLLVGV